MVRVIIVEGTLDEVLTVIQRITRDGLGGGEDNSEGNDVENKNGNGADGETSGMVVLPLTLAAERLTLREQEILAALMGGASNKVIGYRLGITETTVKVHVKKLLKKLGVVNRTQAAVWGQANIQLDQAVTALLPPPAVVVEPAAAAVAG